MRMPRTSFARFSVFLVPLCILVAACANPSSDGTPAVEALVASEAASTEQGDAVANQADTAVEPSPIKTEVHSMSWENAQGAS